MQATETFVSTDVSICESDAQLSSPATAVDVRQPSREPFDRHDTGLYQDTSNGQTNSAGDIEPAQFCHGAGVELNTEPVDHDTPVESATDTEQPAGTRREQPLDIPGTAGGANDADAQEGAGGPSTELTGLDAAEAEPSAHSLPDPSSISARLQNLVVAVSQVEELSRQAREVAATDLTLYNGIAASQHQFEEGFAEAQRIGQEAQAVYRRAFGQEAKALAQPAVLEAREVEQAFAELAEAWRQQAERFLVEHPDVDSLIAEQRIHDEEARRREAARAKAERFQQLVAATDAALRQGLLDEARDCLRLLGREFPAEADRVAPLHDRLDHRVRATNDAAARRIMLEASELQGRGDFDAAVKLLEAVEVQGLSREASEDVFGRWSAACSLLGQTSGLELVRYSSTQGRGIILHGDPSVPYGLVEFSALGMGPSHFRGRVVSAADREGALIVSRARSFRAAELPSELGTAWYGRSYVTHSGGTAVPVRH